MSAATLAWPIDALTARLGALKPGLRVEVWPEGDSSNTTLLDRARAGDPAPTLLVLEHQRAGRGRMGRTWFSEPVSADGPPGPGTLCLSLGMSYAPSDWSGLSLAVGVALAEALGPAVRLKWPNDLWLPEASGTPRKLGGVLIETLPLGDATRYVVIGVGLNLVAPAPRPGLDQATAGWRELAPAASAADLLATIASPLLEAVLQFERDGFSAFHARYAARDGLIGRTIRTAERVPREGVADGIATDGTLRLRDVHNQVFAVQSGDVSVRLC